MGNMGNVMCPEGEFTSLSRPGQESYVIERADILCFKRESISNDYHIERPIGKGASGIVYLATHLRGNFKVAVKKIKISQIDRKMLERVGSEFRILRQCSHPNIVQLMGAYADKDYVHII